MSKIQPISYQNQPKSVQKHGNYSATPSFGKGNWLKPKAIGNYADLSDAEREVAKACEKNIVGYGTKLSEFLAKKDGEVEKQLINAVFTSTLAPLMIAKNPSSNQDKDTKKYMAMRQPISAVIAIAGGIGLTIPIESWISKTFSEGRVSFLDLRMAPDNGTLKKQIMKRDGIKIPSFFNVAKRSERKEIKKQLEHALEKEKDIIQDFYGHLLGTDPNNVKYKDGKVVILDEKGNVKVGKTSLERVITNISSKPDLDAYLEKNSLHNRPFKDFAKENFGFELFEDGGLKPESTKSKLKTISARTFLEKLGIKGFDEEELQRAYNSLRQENVVIPGIERTLGIPGEKAKGFAVVMGSEISRNNQGANGGIKGALTLEQLLHRLGYVKENSNEIDLKKIEELMSQPVSKVIETLKKGTTDGKLDGLTGLILDKAKNVKIDSKSVADFAFNIVKDKAGKLEKQFKAYKGYFSIVSNLFITIVTCSVLNWVYPRFMDKYFPELSKAKKANSKEGGSK